MLDKDIMQQVRTVFSSLTSSYVLKALYAPEHEKAGEFVAFVEDFCSCSEQLSLEKAEAAGKLEFSIEKDGVATGVKFRGIPGGHEFTSLLLAVLNADGMGRNLPDEALAARVKALAGKVELQTYVSLSCTNCPDVVQALNVMALLNPNISSETVDGALWQDEVDSLGIQAVPTVVATGKVIHVGRGELGSLLTAIEENFGVQTPAAPTERSYDVVVVGGGPAGVAAAVYSARKGLSVAVVGERIGGQVKDTVGIENLISVPQTTGAQLAADLMDHLGRYPIEVFENRKVDKAELQGAVKRIATRGGETFAAPAVVIATGAGWRRLGVDGEQEHIGRGVAFCSHCDGPFYKGRHVAVVGGGNSGIEAAVDLAGICAKVTVVEYADALKADTVLQQKAAALDNVEIITSTEPLRVVGDGRKVSGMEVKDRTTGDVRTIALDGIFVQVGLQANSAPFAGQLEMTDRSEIKIDAFCRTSLKGVYAAGDVTDVPYKQIVIAMGEGAKAALSAFDDRVRGVVG